MPKFCFLTVNYEMRLLFELVENPGLLGQTKILASKTGSKTNILYFVIQSLKQL